MYLYYKIVQRLGRYHVEGSNLDWQSPSLKLGRRPVIGVHLHGKIAQRLGRYPVEGLVVHSKSP